MGAGRRQLPGGTRGGCGRPGKSVAAWLDWSEANAATIRVLQEDLADDSTHPARRTQAEQQLEALLVDQPERDYAIDRCVEAWSDLSTCRPIGMAAGAIPWTAIVQWCEWHQLDREGAVMLVHVIRQLDNDRAETAAAKQRLEQAGQARRGSA